MATTLWWMCELWSWVDDERWDVVNTGDATNAVVPPCTAAADTSSSVVRNALVPLCSVSDVFVITVVVMSSYDVADVAAVVVVSTVYKQIHRIYVAMHGEHGNMLCIFISCGDKLARTILCIADHPASVGARVA